ncbi:MAG TPA: CehA/McbA family metallohydrolase [Vicinamibacterales bacterium]|nr:CehA/McbA family metallohydrolase [Vicinamibacterales bacterium]
MLTPRQISGGLTALGILLGSLSGGASPPDLPPFGPYRVVVADFHVHAFPGDGGLPPWEIVREAGRRGLNVVVISNHNQMAAANLGRRVYGGTMPLLIPGQEITTPRFHLIGLGLRTSIDPTAPPEAIVGAVHTQGGAAIIAHPVATSWRGDDALLRSIDGTEIAHPLTAVDAAGRAELDLSYERALAANPRAARIGSSDFHLHGPLGNCRTYVFTESVDVRGIVRAIREGRTVAEDQNRGLYGDRALVDHVYAIRGDRQADARPLFAVLSVLLTVAGMIGTVILR